MQGGNNLDRVRVVTKMGVLSSESSSKKSNRGEYIDMSLDLMRKHV